MVGGRARVATRIAGIVGAAFLIVAMIPASASAAGAGATIARGIQHEFGSCGSTNDGYAMTGSLQGCWWVDTFDVKPMPTQGTMLAHGREHFEGCFGAVCGTFTTTYTYTARFDGATELHGRCHHPITGGTGGFAGASGELSFTDVVDAEPFYYPYWGNIHLDPIAAVSSAVTTTASKVRTNASAKAVAVAPC